MFVVRRSKQRKCYEAIARISGYQTNSAPAVSRELAFVLAALVEMHYRLAHVIGHQRRARISTYYEGNFGRNCSSTSAAL
jgi:hypothetical protein